MAKFSEIVYLINDKLKQESDDSHFTTEHILFLAGSMRALLLKQHYETAKTDIPIANMQTLCLELEHKYDCLRDDITRTIDKIPDSVGSINSNIMPMGDAFTYTTWTMVSPERISFVGYNKWLKNIVYFAVGEDNRVYLAGGNPNIQYLEGIKVQGIFEDPAEAAKYSCDPDEDGCDVMEKKFPLEEPLIPILIDMVYNSLKPDLYTPEDDVNNASDDLAGQLSPNAEAYNRNRR